MGQGYIGIGPPNMEVSDVCSVAFGAKVPYVLRENGDGTYGLVGECYVEGIAEGQVFGMLERGEVRLGAIVLV